MDNKGFTLIELIVTAGILMIVLAMTLPQIDSRSGYVDKIALDLLSDIRYVQSEHMKNPDSQYMVYLDLTKGVYQVRGSFDMFQPAIEKEVVLNKGCTMNYSNASGNRYARIYFTASGAPVNAGTITLRDTVRNEEKQITIIPATGRTIIKE